MGAGGGLCSAVTAPRPTPPPSPPSRSTRGARVQQGLWERLSLGESQTTGRATPSPEPGESVVPCLDLGFRNFSREDFKQRWRYLDKDGEIFILTGSRMFQ